MLIDVVLPNLAFGMEEGRIVRWLKAPGERVRRGEALAEIEGDKATVELEALADGALAEIVVEADTPVAVGSVLARIRPDAPESERSGERPPQVSPIARRLAAERGVDVTELKGTGPGGRILRRDVAAQAERGSAERPAAAPAARKLAREHGIDLRAARGSGKGGRIIRADVERLLAREAPTAASPAKPEDVHVAPLTPMRRAIARSLAHSAREAPHFHAGAHLDFSDALAALDADIRLTDLLIYVTAQALRDVPQLNATHEHDELLIHEHVHLAIAVALPDGLIAPVLRRADDYSPSGLAARRRDLIRRAREGDLRAQELQGGSFTLSNLGVIRQLDHFTAIINPPQVGILAIGAVKERPLAIGGGLFARHTAYLTLAADHRFVDGMTSARFLEAWDTHLRAFAAGKDR